MTDPLDVRPAVEAFLVSCDSGLPDNEALAAARPPPSAVSTHIWVHFRPNAAALSADVHLSLYPLLELLLDSGVHPLDGEEDVPVLEVLVVFGRHEAFGELLEVVGALGDRHLLAHPLLAGPVLPGDPADDGSHG